MDILALLVVSWPLPVLLVVVKWVADEAVLVLKAGRKGWQRQGSLRQKVLFHTHYGAKFEEVKRLLGANSIEQVHFADLPTYEDMDLSELASRRVRDLWQRLSPRRACFLEEASLEIEDTGFPGHEFRCIVGNERYFRTWVTANKHRAATIRLAVAFADKDGKVEVFERSQRGRIVAPVLEEEWQQGIGWDPIFAPAGFQGRTIANMLDQKHFVDVRLQLYLCFRTLVNPAAAGAFELHITLAIPPPVRNSFDKLMDLVDRFRIACSKHQQRALIIFEDSGPWCKQLQLQTAQYRTFKSAEAAAGYAFELSRTLQSQYGLEVARTRVEAMAHSKHSPQTDAEARRYPEEYYFEFHRRATLGLEPTQVELLQDICRETSATRRGASLHVSRVGRKHFVNGRFYRMGRDSALRVWKRMEEAVESSGIGFSKPALMEYAILDDYPTMDSDTTSPCVINDRMFDRLVEWAATPVHD